jgi:hypothetical protein
MSDDKNDLEKNDTPPAPEAVPSDDAEGSEGERVELESFEVERPEIQRVEVVRVDKERSDSELIEVVRVEGERDEAGRVEIEVAAGSFDVDGTIAEIKKQLEAEPDKFAKKRPPANPVGVMMNLVAMFMFVGGAGVSLMMLARAFELHGNVLVAYVVVSAAAILGMTGSLLCKILGDADRWLAGAVFGACAGAISALVFYGQTRNYSWWQ